MRPELRDELHAWVTKAQHDLCAAERLTLGDDPILDVAVYHCQQAAEKALKGFLTFHEEPFERTHSLPTLVWQCVDVDESFDSLRDAAELLNPLATRFRYPGEIMEPDIDEAREAIARAEEVVQFVMDRLPRDHD